jgi:ubiquitin-protein ligase
MIKENARKSRVMMAQFRKATANPNDFAKFTMTDDVNTWYILINGVAGNDNEFVGGEYLVKIFAPADFPFDPPHFYFLTANGVYGTESKVCVSIGEFHKKDYPAALGMSGFVTQLVSGMIGWREIGHGIQILNTTIEDKKELAARSVASNAAYYANIVDMINASFAEYSKKWTGAS